MDARGVRCPLCGEGDISVRVSVDDGTAKAQAVCSSCGYKDLAITGDISDIGIIVDVAAGKASQFYKESFDIAGMAEEFADDIGADIAKLTTALCSSFDNCSKCPLNDGGEFRREFKTGIACGSGADAELMAKRIKRLYFEACEF